MTVQDIKDCGGAVQVMFYDGEGMCSGIMFGDKIVCACCGAIFEAEEVYENAQNDGVEVAIRMFLGWVDISDKIKGNVSKRLKRTVIVKKEG